MLDGAVFLFLIVSILFPGFVPESGFLKMVQEHLAATIGLAVSAISAFSVVVVLNLFARDPEEI